MQQVSACGLFDCDECKFHDRGVCLGCARGNAFLEQWGRGPCRIYTCVRALGINTCEECSRPSCSLRSTTDIVCPLRAGLENKRHWAWKIASHLQRRRTPCHRGPSIPAKTMTRFRWYLDQLDRFAEQGMDVVSSRELADKVGVNSSLLRRDFCHIGELGTPGLGYHVNYLREQIRGLLERNTCSLVWVGAQWLANAANIMPASLGLNFRIVAAVDTRPEWIGRRVGEWDVQPLSDLSALVEKMPIHGAVLALPEDALRAADVLVQCGIRGILNLTPVTLRLPPEVSVHHIDLLGEMMALASEVTSEASAA